MRAGESTAASAAGTAHEVLCVVRWPVGGIRTYLFYYYPHLQERGYRFTFLGPDNEDFARFATECRKCLDAEFVAAPVERRRWRVLRLVRRLAGSGRYALVHSQGIGSGGLVSWATLGQRVPHVVTSHDVFPPGEFEGLFHHLRIRVLERLLLRSAAVVSVSEGAARNLGTRMPRLGKGRTRHVTIPNGIDVSRFEVGGEVEKQRLRERLGLPGDTAVLGFLGRFMKQKGFLPLLDALALLLDDPPHRPFRLVAVGSGDLDREYKAAAERRGVSSLITFLPFHADPAPVLAGLDVLVMPSLWEAAPLLPMEAMVMGIPVLGTTCVGLSDVLAGSPSRVAPPGDARALCQALKGAIDRPWREEALAYVPVARARFDRNAGVERLGALFSEVMGFEAEQLA